MNRTFNKELYQDYLRASADTALEPFVVDPNVPLRYYPEVDDYTMSCAMERTPGGRIWLAWFAGEDSDGAVLLLAHSDDDARTFSRPDFIVDPGYIPGGVHRSAVVGCLWTAPDGRLFLFVTQSVGYYDGRAGVWQSICANPDGAHPTWSKPERLWHGAGLNKPTVLRNGTWLLPVSLWTRAVAHVEADFSRRSDLFHELDARRGTNILASTDQGQSWTLRGHTCNPAEQTFDEPMILERRDGSLLMYMRDASGMTWSESHDEGHTWRMPEKVPFLTASARFFLRQLESGNALLVRYANPQDPHRRSHMTAFLSRDDGATWEGGLLLDTREPISYPDGFQAPDGTIYIQYDRARVSGEILLATFTEADVLAGRNVSGRVVLRHPMIQSFTAARAATAPAGGADAS